MTKTIADLPRFLQEAGAKPFGYDYAGGQIDCSRFVMDWLRVAGCDPKVADFGDYADAKQAAAIMRRAGGIDRMAQRAADASGLIECERPRPCDVGVVKAGKKRVFGIYAGDGMWIVKGDRQITIAPCEMVRAWQLPRGSAGAEIVGLALLSLISVPSTVIIGSLTTATLLGTIVISAAAIGLQYALMSVGKQRQDPQATQQVVKEAAGPRVRHYGTVKVGGKVVFSATTGGRWHQVVVTGSGRIDSVVETWLNDKVAVLTGGVNSTPPWESYALVTSTLGLPTETAHAGVVAAFPDVWTAAHRLDGLSTYCLTLVDCGAKAFGRYFAGGIPKVRQVLRGARVYDPRSHSQGSQAPSTWVWSDNASLCILDYLTHPDGYRQSKSDCNLESFAKFADVCDQLPALKGGGTERRYRLSGSYSFAEAPKDVLRRMLATCDAFVYLDAEGRITITGGAYQEPAVTIDGSCITAVNWRLGNDATERANELKPIYTSPSHDFQEVEAAAWQDTASIVRDGLVSQQIPLTMVPSHTQAQRLAKIAGRRINSPKIAKLKCSLGAMVAYQQRFIRIQGTALGVDAPFIVDKFDLVLGEDGVSVMIDATQVDPSDWAWNAATEEGDATPIPVDTNTLSAIETVLNFTPIIQPVAISVGVTGGQFKATWTTPTRTSLATEVQYRRRVSSGPDVWEEWVTQTVESGIQSFTSGVIQNDGSLYELRARFIATGGTPGAWTTAVSIVAVADATAPAVVTSLALTPGAGQIAATWTAPNSANFAGARVYWNTSNSLTGATLFATVYGSPSQAMSRTVTGLSVGVKWILITSINGSGVASSAASSSATVT